MQVKVAILSAMLCMGGAMSAYAEKRFASDTFVTSSGELTITFIGHGTLMFRFGNKVFHVDPYGKLADYAALPKADAILITHDHADHLDPAALAAVRKPDTAILLAEACRGKVEGTVMTNGHTVTVLGVRAEAVPAYNIRHLRDNGLPFHPRAAGNGYILNFGDKRVYVAGDTENTPEMKALKGIDIAFLPMNLPYTMTPEMVADAAKAFKPKILYPYHFGDTDPARLAPLLKDEPGIELRVRELR